MRYLLLLSLLTLIVSDESTKPYACLESSQVGNKEICYYLLNDIQYIRSCPIGQKCETSTITDDIATCRSQFIKKYYGESCDINQECLSGYCIDHKCKSKSINATCINSWECPLDSGCILFTCQKYAKENQTCITEFSCEYGHTCSGIVGKCVKNYSVKTGTKADADIICESGFRLKDGICYDTVMKDGGDFKKCEVQSDCAMDVIDKDGNVVDSTNGECKSNYKGENYCTLPSTSNGWKNYVKAVHKEIEDLNDRDVHQALIYYEPLLYSVNLKNAIFKKDPEYHNVEDCILDALVVSIGSGFVKVSFGLIVLISMLIA